MYIGEHKKLNEIKLKTLNVFYNLKETNNNNNEIKI